MRRLALLLLAAGCAGSPARAPTPVDLSTPVLLSAAGDDSVIAESLATVKAKIILVGEVQYPISLQAAGIGGAVKLQFVIRSSGVPDTSSVQVVTSTHPGFENPAIFAVLSSRYQPALLDGRRVAVRVGRTVRFQPYH